jgi:hypothetical protein
MESTHDVDTTQQRQNDIPSKIKLIVHNQCPDIELISPVYASNGATCYLSSDQRADVGSKMQADFSIHPGHKEAIGILMYKLERKSTYQSNDNIIPSEDELSCTQLVMIWKVYKSGKFHVYSAPIEHDRCRVWDRDSMMKLAESYELFDVIHSPVKHTWLTHNNNALLMTSLDVIRKEECYKLEMTISEGNIKDYTWKPRYIGLNRWVSIMTLTITFTY